MRKKVFKKFNIGGLHPQKPQKSFFEDFSAAIIVILLVFGIVASNNILLRYMIQPMNNFLIFFNFLPKMCFFGAPFSEEKYNISNSAMNFETKF